MSVLRSGRCPLTAISSPPPPAPGRARRGAGAPVRPLGRARRAGAGSAPSRATGRRRHPALRDRRRGFLGRRRAPAEALGEAAVDRARGRHRELLADDTYGPARRRGRRGGVSRGSPSGPRPRSAPRARGVTLQVGEPHVASTAGRASAPRGSPVDAFSAPLQRHRHAREAGRVAHGVGGGLGRAQALDEVEERGDVVGVERDDELLVVEAERVGRVVVDRRGIRARSGCAPA